MAASGGLGTALPSSGQGARPRVICARADKEEAPWYRAGRAPLPYGDTNNVLGTHWISLDIPHYGIHGTWETNTIGQQSSQGCVRLLNGNIEELYVLLPEGTPVTITE